MNIDDETIREPEPDNRTAHDAEVQHASVTPLVRYHVTKTDIENTRSVYAALSADTTEGYESVRKAIAFCRSTRVQVEKRRKELKADSLEWGRRVDSGAKELTAIIESIEAPLQAKKDAVDAEKERAKREADEARQREAEAAAAAEREAEQAELREEQARLDAERAEIAAQRAEIERAQAELKAAREQAEREEFERQTRIRLETEAREQAERDRVADEEARVAKAERQTELARRLDALKPDVEKIRAFANTIGELRAPAVAAAEAQEAIAIAVASLADIVNRLDRFANQTPLASAAE